MIVKGLRLPFYHLLFKLTSIYLVNPVISSH